MIEFPKRRNSAQLYQSFPKEKNRRGERKSLPPAIPCYELLEATGCPAREGHGEEEDDEVEEDDDELHLEHGEE